jgi:hypothetical protein
MLAHIASRNEVGKKLVSLSMKLRYAESVKNNEILSMAFHLKATKDLKKGDKWLIPSGVVFNQDATISVEEEDFFPLEGTERGMIVLEVASTVLQRTMGAKGLSFQAVVLNIESAEMASVAERYGFVKDEEVLIFVGEESFAVLVPVLNEAVVAAKKKEGRKEAIPIGKRHLSIFAGKSGEIEEDGKGERENVMKIREIRKTASWLRKSVEAKQGIMVLNEGGFKKDTYYLERLTLASREHLSDEMMHCEMDGKWQEIQNFRAVENLRIMSNKGAFQDFVVHGTWDTEKYGCLLDQFISNDERINDSNAVQLTQIMRNMSIVMKMAHGTVWADAFAPIIARLERGAVGRVEPAHTKFVLGETWESCNLTLQGDDNTANLRVGGVDKVYNLDNVDEVVKMFKDRFEGVPETDLASKSEFEKNQSKKKVSAIPTRSNAWESGRKHHLRAEKDDDESSARKVVVSEKGNPSKRITGMIPSGNPREPQRTKGTVPSKLKGAIPWLCMFNLRHQLLGFKEDCLKIGDCNRDHYDATKRGTPGYAWTLQTMSEQVGKASESVLTKGNKKKLVEAIKQEFA